ncbi:hypothetical protein [Bradyrhizobium sp. STM 3557]|uniref:COG3904 family protein n=1 Tax=Bradyrhizobium sp. STM 3557 TaxID=578920 RepID=UPI00388ECEDE
MVDDLDQNGPSFQRSPTGPWVAPPRAVPAPRAQPRIAATGPSVYWWRRLASVIFFSVLVAGTGVRAYRDLSRPEAWAYWKDQYLSPSLNSTLIPNVDIDHSGHGRTALAISGEIGPAAASWLRDRIDDAHLAKGDVVLLSSPGGNLQQAIIMGEIIRAHELATAVGVADRSGRVRAAYCASACVMAYAGGWPRYGVENSALGVHRFTTTAPVADPVADAQRVTGSILRYMTRMGVSAEIVEAMSETREIRWLKDKDAQAMNLVTAPVHIR